MRPGSSLESKRSKFIRFCPAFKHIMRHGQGVTNFSQRNKLSTPLGHESFPNSTFFSFDERAGQPEPRRVVVLSFARAFLTGWMYAVRIEVGTMVEIIFDRCKRRRRGARSWWDRTRSGRLASLYRSCKSIARHFDPVRPNGRSRRAFPPIATGPGHGSDPLTNPQHRRKWLQNLGLRLPYRFQLGSFSPDWGRTSRRPLCETPTARTRRRPDFDWGSIARASLRSSPAVLRSPSILS